MATRRVAQSSMALVLICVLSSSSAHGQAASTQIYNTVKQKLLDGQPVVGGTVSSPDPNIYCAMANSGFDFLWIEMQHSPLGYQDVARMIWACRGAPAIPFIRVPDATEGDIQKATDGGALGIIVPMVATAEKMERAVRFAKFPPLGERSQGGGQYRALWGDDYRDTANENIMVVAMIEQLTGVAVVEEIAAVPGVDAVFAAASDLGSFSGKRQGDPEYEALVTTIRDATLGAGLALGGPLGWANRNGFSFFQAADDTDLIRLGAEAALESAGSGLARIEGSQTQR
ncbi:MAG TPA: aldolase/citrate lyase family protein [Acidobacteriota bacterium]|nr:aldolase/citrate lyase family protein [Acidobacteriota bacterium]